MGGVLRACCRGCYERRFRSSAEACASLRKRARWYNRVEERVDGVQDMSERAFSVFAFVDANAEIEKTLRKYGFHKPEGSEQWRNEQGQTPAQWAHAMAPGETPGYALL